MLLAFVPNLDWRVLLHRHLAEDLDERPDFCAACEEAAQHLWSHRPAQALAILYRICCSSPGEPLLGLFDVRSAVAVICGRRWPGPASPLSLMASIDEPRREALERLGSGCPRVNAEAMVMLGAFERALSVCEGREELWALNTRAIANSLLERDGGTRDAFHIALEAPDWAAGMTLPVRHNFGLQLFWQRELYAARTQFQRCRKLFPHDRSAQIWLQHIDRILSGPDGPEYGVMALTPRAQA